MYGARQGGGAGPIVLGPGGLFWTRRRAGVSLLRSGLGGVVFQRLHQNSYPGRLVLRRWGGVPKNCSQNPRWGGVPKNGVVFQNVVPKWVGAPKVGVMLSQNPHDSMGLCSKVGVVFQKVVPESPLCILLKGLYLFQNYLKKTSSAQ